MAAPLAAVVADEPSRLDLDRGLGEDGSWQQVADRLLMPLPTNPEQEAVARRLAEHRGVTVQGPPGTGKTHTIANLISHLVGHGKRVLVTSQKEQALLVLRDKIPESIRDLSVAVLGSSAASLAQLDQSVQAIYEHAVGLDRVPARARIAALDSHLGELHRDIGALRTRISASIARERDSYAIGTATHSPSTLGQWLAVNAADLGYIPDEIDPSATCPLSVAEIADLYRLARVLDSADCAQARLYLPVAEKLAPPSELASASAEVRDIRDRLAATEGIVEDRFALEGLGSEGLFTLIDAVERSARQLAQLEQPWLAAIRAELRTAVFAATWRDQMKAWQEGIEELAAWQGRLLGHSVVLPDGGLPPTELIELLQQLRDRLAAGKGVSKTFQKDLHRVREACTVDEEPPRKAEDAELCIIEARSQRRRYELIRGWNGAVGRIAGPLIDPGMSHPEYLLNQYMGSIGAASAWEDRAWYALRDRLRACGVRVSEQATSAGLTALADTLRTAALHITEKDLTAWLNMVRKHLADGASHPQASGLWQSLIDAFDAYAWDQWGRIIEEVRRVGALTSDVALLDELTGRLAQVAPFWTSRIVGSHGDEAVAGPVATALRAWEWRQADTWLSAITAADDPATLQRHLEGKLRASATATADLASESAWLAVAERLTDAERRALTAWAQALRKVGKGTGKYAHHWRAIAQQQMEQAQTAVPVWIMPAYRVVESFDPATAIFDVVIVDESSQCDLFGLAALGIARKAVVVGDDKQISPQAVGTDESAVHELIRQHIPDLPQAELLDIKTSLYDLSKMRFPGVIMLREHFRCLPEIIEFSNQLAYGGKILPLREQPVDPTWQSVVDIHIRDGYRQPGTDTNPPEADYIVVKIAELCADRRYDGKTFGVISLLGDAQAQLIQGKVIDRLGEQEVERRRIRCGNAYHFQGDERHVIFLSLVVAAGEGRRIGAMTKDADRQRINVAASRAKDQMWCIRSISPDELHPDDVRGRFIRYCQNPARIDDATSSAEDRFDSDFERDVYRHLVGRGYRVKVQHRVGRFRIDLVVEGRRGRLAVELDGDAYHGPDRWEADRNRQGILERLGWTFHRIRGSAYYRDPDTALASLWDRLEALGIRPADAPDPSAPPVVIVDGAVEEAAARRPGRLARVVAAIQVGDLLRSERYEIQRLLRSACDKKVYLARDRELGCQVALDVFSNNAVMPTGLTVSAWETRVLGQLGDHRNIATVLDHWENGETAVMVSRYLSGGSLRDLIARSRESGDGLPVEDILRIAIEIASGLEHIHGRRILYRDLQPRNVLFDEWGTVHLVDFDTAVSLDDRDMSDLSHRPVINYMAPELTAGGSADERADLYALGATIYEMCQGRPPFSGPREEILAARRTGPPPALERDDLPAALSDLVFCLLAPEREQRSASATEVIERLEGLRAAQIVPESAAAPRPGHSQPLPKPDLDE